MLQEERGGSMRGEMEEERLKLSRMMFFDVMSSVMYVYGTGNEDKPVDVEEMIDYLRSLARMINRSKKEG